MLVVYYWKNKNITAHPVYYIFGTNLEQKTKASTVLKKISINRNFLVLKIAYF